MKKVVQKLTDRSAGVITLRFRPNVKIDVNALNRYLEQKDVGEEEIGVEHSQKIKKLSWTESGDVVTNVWRGATPKIDISYDVVYGYLLHVYIQIEKTGFSGKRLDEEELRNIFMSELEKAKVLTWSNKQGSAPSPTNSSSCCTGEYNRSKKN